MDSDDIAGGVKLETLEPPVPAGLSSLTAAQKALVEFLGIKQDLLIAAAWASPDASAATDSTHTMEQWVTNISADETRPYLLLLKILEWLAAEQRVLLTHDVTTMRPYAEARVAEGKPMPGVFEVNQYLPIGQAIEEILLVTECSLEGEWEGQIRFLPLR